MSEIWRDELHEKDRREKLATYLFAMKEDLSEWIAGLLNISVNADTFMTVFDNGIHLCRLANMIQKAAEKYLTENPDSALKLPEFVPTYKERGATHSSFVSRDNVANFIRWCRALGIQDVIMFESEDLVLHKFQKPVILTLLDVARRASKFDIEPPDLVIMEEQIDEEIALEEQAIALEQTGQRSIPTCQVELHHNDAGKSDVVKSKTTKTKAAPKKVKNFIPKNLDTLVKEVVQQCTCEDSFPIEKIADGKYKIGENRVLIFVRVMRNHVMVRVGGGWDTLENYILKHDPCRTGGRSNTILSGARQRSKCQTPSNHHHHHSHHESTLLHSASNTSVTSSDSNSSTSSLPQLSPVNNNNNDVLQGMICVFGESGARPEVVSTEQASPSSTATKRLEPPAKTAAKRKNSTPCKQTGGGNGLGSRHGSLNDVRDSGIGSAKTKKLSGKTPVKNSKALRESLLQADLTFSRSKTSDAILRRSRRRDADSPSSVVKRRGNGNLSREPSSENLATPRPKSAGMRRKSVGRRSPEVVRRSAVSPAPARRKLEPEYEQKSTQKKSSQKNSALRKDLNDNDLMFSRSFSADAITRGLGARRQADTSQIFPSNSPLVKNHGSPSRIPVPVASYGKPRGLNRTSVLNGGSSGTFEANGIASGTPNVETSGALNGGNHGLTVSNNDNEVGVDRCIHCSSQSCTCDEGFIDGEVVRSPLRPTSLFHNTPNDLECKNRDCNSNGGWDENAMFLEIPQQRNGDGFSENSESLEWKEVMTGILKYEENRTSGKNLYDNV